VIYLMSPSPRLFGESPHSTSEAAKKAGVHGWNLRCQRCGQWGAGWYYYRPECPEWGDLALCGPHASALHNELRRHKDAVRDMIRENFRQEVSR
jgi:hypothetical protein